MNSASVKIFFMYLALLSQTFFSGFGPENVCCTHVDCTDKHKIKTLQHSSNYNAKDSCSLLPDRSDLHFIHISAHLMLFMPPLIWYYFRMKTKISCFCGLRASENCWIFLAACKQKPEIKWLCLLIQQVIFFEKMINFIDCVWSL